MVNFQQIIEWILSIANLSKQVRPVIDRIRSEVKTKTLNGIQFIDFDSPTLSNIKELNQILEENGLEKIDEAAFQSIDSNPFSAPSLDPERILQIMQQEFTEEELAAAVSQPEFIEQLRDLTQLDFDLADICDPPVVIETPEFSESEISFVACEIPTDVGEGVLTDPVGSVPTNEPTIPLTLDPEKLSPSDGNSVQPGDDGNTSIPQLDPKEQENLFEQLSQLAGTPNPENGPECLKKMQQLSSSVQEKVSQYTKAKEEMQRIQIDYFYQMIVGSYYESFIDGYGEIESLKKELSQLKPGTQASAERSAEIQERLRNLPNDFSNVSSRSSMQDKMEEVILPFSNQFSIEINSGFLGLFQSYPKIAINKDELPLEGKLKDIPDELIKFIDETPKDDPDAPSIISARAEKSDKELQKAFDDTLSNVKYFSFGFGLNWYINKEDIDAEFSEEASIQIAKKSEIETKYNELKKKEKESQDAIDQINKQIMEELKKLNCQSVEVPPDVEAGKDLGFKNVSKNPTIFDYAWWVKFSKLATIVNLVPIHWPVGLLIPTPAALIKVPFPIIWIPLFVAPTDKLIAVIFIGQCGILPCPFIFLQHFLPIPLGPFISGNPYFALAIRGPINISSHEPLPPVVLPSFDLVFTALNAVLASFRNGVTTDFEILVQQVKDEIENVERNAKQYLARIDIEAFDLTKIARDLALKAVADAKSYAELAIEQAKEEGERLVEEAKARYNNALEAGNAVLAIRQNIQQKINEAQATVEDARNYGKTLINDAEQKALALRRSGEDRIKAVIEQGKRQYEERLQQIEDLEEQYERTLETLRDIISRIQTPSINLGLINLQALLSSLTLSLGSLKSLAADLSPKLLQFGFPTEIDPKFSASLPMFQDELPVWERLSLLNIPFLLFLWKWCKAGKEKGGFFRDPF